MTPSVIARQFDARAEVIGPWRQTGNINQDCFHVRLSDGEGILQRLNTDVFPNAEIVMDNAVRWATAQPVSVEFLRADASYWVVNRNQYWRMMRKIEGGNSYFRLDETRDPVAYARGLGSALARAHGYAASLDPRDFAVSLPGFRDPHHYWRQHQVATETGWPDRISEMGPEIQFLEDRRHLMITVRDQTLIGRIRETVIHGDTKIENFLFDENGKVIALVDLDTVMAGSWLMDWGDMMRSLTNPVGEKADPSEVVFADDVYRVAREGYLMAAQAPETETRLMETAALGVTLEQAIRFLSDYLRGDTYYRLGPNGPPDLNRTRARVQIELARQMEGALTITTPTAEA